MPAGESTSFSVGKISTRSYPTSFAQRCSFDGRITVPVMADLEFPIAAAGQCRDAEAVHHPLALVARCSELLGHPLCYHHHCAAVREQPAHRTQRADRGRSCGWMNSNAVTRSFHPASVGSAASRTSNFTRSSNGRITRLRVRHFDGCEIQIDAIDSHQGASIRYRG